MPIRKEPTRATILVLSSGKQVALVENKRGPWYHKKATRMSIYDYEKTDQGGIRLKSELFWGDFNAADLATLKINHLTKEA